MTRFSFSHLKFLLFALVLFFIPQRAYSDTYPSVSSSDQWSIDGWKANPSSLYYSNKSKFYLGLGWTDMFLSGKKFFVEPSLEFALGFNTPLIAFEMNTQRKLTPSGESNDWKTPYLTTQTISFETAGAFGKEWFSLALAFKAQYQMYGESTIRDSIRPLSYIASYFNTPLTRSTLASTYRADLFLSASNKETFSFSLFSKGLISDENNFGSYSWEELINNLGLTLSLRTPTYNALDIQNLFSLVGTIGADSVICESKRTIYAELFGLFQISGNSEMRLGARAVARFYNGLSIDFSPKLVFSGHSYTAELSFDVPWEALNSGSAPVLTHLRAKYIV